MAYLRGRPVSESRMGVCVDDLNYIFQRQQQERQRAQAASCDEARKAHERLAEMYEDRIRELTSRRMAS
jgi:hypothetical protein